MIIRGKRYEGLKAYKEKGHKRYLMADLAAVSNGKVEILSTLYDREYPEDYKGKIPLAEGSASFDWLSRNCYEVSWKQLPDNWKRAFKERLLVFHGQNPRQVMQQKNREHRELVENIHRVLKMGGLLWQENIHVPGWETTRAVAPEYVAFRMPNGPIRRLSIRKKEENDPFEVDIQSTKGWDIEYFSTINEAIDFVANVIRSPTVALEGKGCYDDSERRTDYLIWPRRHLPTRRVGG